MRAEVVRPTQEKKRSSSETPTFLERIFAFFFGSNDPDREKKRLLKEIEQRLRSDKHRFYRPKSEEALPAMARFFYELYQITGPARLLVDHAESSEVLRSMMIEHGFDERQRALHEALSEGAITEQATHTDLRTLQTEVKDRATQFVSSFDAHQVKEINQSYNLLSVFLDIIHFDYFFLLRKFDSRLPEQDFRYSPHFETIQGEYLVDDLADFLTLLHTVDPQAEWKELLSVLKDYRGADVVAPGNWHKLLRLLADVRKSQVLELCLRHVSKNPYYKVKAVHPNEKIVEDFLSKLKARSELVVQKLLRQEYERTVEKYTGEVFGKGPLSRVKYYTARYNTVFAQRMVAGFTLVEPINFLHAFLADYFDKEIRELVDLLIVRGKWATPLTSQQLSESFHVLLESADDLRKFDERLADEEELGIRIKSLVWNADRDRSAIRDLREVLRSINDQAMSIVKRSTRNLVIMGKSLKIVLEDYDKPSRELIVNWKEIESFSSGTIRAKIVDAYKKIYYFVQLIQLYVKKEPTG